MLITITVPGLRLVVSNQRQFAWPFGINFEAVCKRSIGPWPVSQSCNVMLRVIRAQEEPAIAFVNGLALV